MTLLPAAVLFLYSGSEASLSNERGDLITHFVGMQAAEARYAVLHDIAGAEAGAKRFGDRVLDGVGFLREIQ